MRVVCYGDARIDLNGEYSGNEVISPLTHLINDNIYIYFTLTIKIFLIVYGTSSNPFMRH